MIHQQVYEHETGIKGDLGPCTCCLAGSKAEKPAASVLVMCTHSISTILYCIVVDQSLRSSVRVTLSLFPSFYTKNVSANSVDCKLAQRWVHTISTKVANSSALLGVASNQPKYTRSILREVQSHDLNHLQSPSGEMFEQVVHVAFYTYKWLQFAVADTALAVLAVPTIATEYTYMYCPILHHKM